MEKKQTNYFELNQNNWAELRRIENPQTEIRTTRLVLADYLPKKIAALEAYRELNTNKTLGLAVILGVLVTATAGSLNNWAGALSAGILAIFGAFFYKKAATKAKYLEEEYNIKPEPKDI